MFVGRFLLADMTLEEQLRFLRMLQGLPKKPHGITSKPNGRVASGSIYFHKSLCQDAHRSSMKRSCYSLVRSREVYVNFRAVIIPLLRHLISPFASAVESPPFFSCRLLSQAFPSAPER